MAVVNVNGPRRQVQCHVQRLASALRSFQHTGEYLGVILHKSIGAWPEDGLHQQHNPQKPRFATRTR